MKTQSNGVAIRNSNGTGDSRKSNRSQEFAKSINSNTKETPMEEGEKEEGVLEEEPRKTNETEQNLGLVKPFQIIAHYLPNSEKKHVLLLAEDIIEGDEKSIYTWDIDSNYDPGSILDFELEFQKQEGNWPFTPFERIYPNGFEYLSEYCPFHEHRKPSDVNRPRDTLLEGENSEIWPLFCYAILSIIGTVLKFGMKQRKYFQCT